MEQSLYRHIGCFIDQVKLTRALVQDLDEVVKEVNPLGEHEQETSQKITELEAICKMLREDSQRLREERTTLEGMIQSRDKLILEMAEEYELNHMGENDDDEDENDDDEGNAVAPPAPVPAAMPKEIVEEEDPMENGPQELDDLDGLGIWMRVQMKAALTWMNGFPKMGVMIEIELSSLSL
jgi:predicted nuclease with TOPRIM domain